MMSRRQSAKTASRFTIRSRRGGGRPEPPAEGAAPSAGARPGPRSGPLTNVTAKPLVTVAGKALIDWTIDPFVDVGVTTAVVNVHHHAAFMRRHLCARKQPVIVISDETDALLDTGGGII